MLQVRKKGLRDIGGTLRAEEAHRIAVGAETLALRLRRVCDNALALRDGWRRSRASPACTTPACASHPQHERAARLFRGGFGLFCFELREGIDTFAFLDALQLVIVSSHLADNRTLAIPVAQTIFYEMGPERRAEMGIADGLVRLSVGIEDIADLIDDFSRALDTVERGGERRCVPAAPPAAAARVAPRRRTEHRLYRG